MKIVFNGVEYESIEAMPPEGREAWRTVMDKLTDRDGDGIPDVLQGKGGAAGATPESVTVTSRTWTSVDEMPAEVRSGFERLLHEAGRGGPATSDQPRVPVAAPGPRLGGPWGEVPRSRSKLPWVLVAVLAAALVAVLLAR